MVLTLGMAALGAVLGLLVAWSASPVVATVIPLLFGLIGGAGSVSFLKADFSKPGVQRQIQAAGASLLSCCSAFLVFLVIGVLTKGYVETMQHDALTYQLSGEQLANPAAAIDRLLLRQRLVGIGATKSEIGSIIGTSDKEDYRSAVDTIAKSVTALLAAYDQIPAADQQKLEQTTDFASFIVAVRYFSISKGSMSQPGPMTRDAFRFLTNGLYSASSLAILPTNVSTGKRLTDYPAVITAFTSLSEALWSSAVGSDPTTRTAAIDDFIKNANGAGTCPSVPIAPFAGYKVLPAPPI